MKLKSLTDRIARRIWYAKTGAIMSSDDHPDDISLTAAQLIIKDFQPTLDEAVKAEREKALKEVGAWLERMYEKSEWLASFGEIVHFHLPTFKSGKMPGESLE